MEDQLRGVFNIFNIVFFQAGLPSMQFKIDLTKKFAIRWVADSNCILIGSQISSIRTKYDLYHAILHEMVHIQNSLNRISDVNENQYHNKNFAKVAVKIGLCIKNCKNQGWSETSIENFYTGENKNIKVNIEANKFMVNALSKIDFDMDLFEEKKEEIEMALSQIKPAKLFFLKYACSCPSPYNSMRSGRRPDGENAPDLTCNRCNTKLVCVSL